MSIIRPEAFKHEMKRQAELTREEKELMAIENARSAAVWKAICDISPTLTTEQYRRLLDMRRCH